MTYWLLGATLSLAAFFLIYVFLSVGVALVWRLLRKRASSFTATALYGLRVTPAAAAVVLVAFFLIPSFLYLEPSRTGETVSLQVWVLALGGLTVVGVGAISAFSASWETARFVASCGVRHTAQIKEPGAPAMEISTTGPALLVAGIRRPQLVISEQVRRLLDQGEMRAAIRHEMAHVRFHDNLKKLVLRCCRFPLLADLEKSWMRAAEFAADDAAAISETAAVDLASALLKVARLPSTPEPPLLAMSLVLDSDSALRLRVQRLLAWQPRASKKSSRFALLSVSVVALLATISYAPMLAHIHELSELLVR